MFLYSGVLLLAGVATLATPDSGWAQRHGGGGHVGGAHFGGARVGGAGFGSARLGGARFGGYYGGIYGNGYRFGNSRAYYYPRYGYGYYPYFGSYGYNPYFYNTYPYVSSSAGYDSPYTGLYGGNSWSDSAAYTFVTPPTTSYQAYYPPATGTPTPDLLAHLSFTVPADAQLWLNERGIETTGPTRQFESRPLTPGIPYAYKVRARWTENGHEVTQTQQVEVAAGAHVNVTFPVPAKSAAQKSTPK
jgi:uncharacterized protein (TIGR03000 family)